MSWFRAWDFEGAGCKDSWCKGIIILLVIVAISTPILILTSSFNLRHIVRVRRYTNVRMNAQTRRFEEILPRKWQPVGRPKSKRNTRCIPGHIAAADNGMHQAGDGASQASVGRRAEFADLGKHLVPGLQGELKA